MKRRVDWWAVINCDREITRYYRWFVKSRYWIDLDQPSWDAHVSVIRGERPAEDKKHLWKKYDGLKVNFKYSPVIKQAVKRQFWYIEVQCPMLNQIRQEFGFPCHWNSHLTIGRTNDYND